MKRRLIAMILLVCLVLPLLPTSALAANSVVASGYCGGEGDGTNLTWTLDSEGTLTISGSGAMENFSMPSSAPPWDKYSIKKLQVEYGVTSIGVDAFCGQHLLMVLIADSVKTIGYEAFNGCTSLTTITLPEGLEEIGDRAFIYCRGLKSISLPSTLKTIGGSAFEECDSLESLVVPDSVTKCGTEFICDCENLKYVYIGTGVSKIPNFPSSSYTVFLNCNKLKRVDVAEDNPTYSSIDGVIFSKDKKSLIYYPVGRSGAYAIPSGTEKINQYAFANSLLLSKVSLPDTVTWVSNYAFVNCPALCDIAVDSGNTDYSDYDGVLVNDRYSGYVTLEKYPAGKTQSTYTVSAGIHNIESHAFEGSKNLKSVVMPKSVSAIFSYAFKDCELLRDVYFKGNAPSTVNAADSDYPSFSKSVTLYYMKENSTWTDSDAYDAKAGTWNGYTLKVWEDHPADDPTDDPSESLAGSAFTKSGIFSYRDEEDNNQQYEYTYSDSYFFSPSIKKRVGAYNHQLAVMSLNLAMAAFNSANAATSGYEEDIAAENVKNLLDELKFDKIDISTYKGMPKTNSIAYALGNKKINCNKTDYTLIAVAIRGGGYEAEWGGNFTVGSNGNHKGFQTAADTVIDGLKTYLSDNAITGNVKLWIVGYSRAAATANLTAAAIDDGALNDLNDISLQLKDIYAYTFETPKGTTSSDTLASRYQNIFNIINPIDLVPKVAPRGWSFKRYGTDYYMPSGSTKSGGYNELLMCVTEEYTRIKLGSNYTGNLLAIKQLTSQDTTLDEIVDAVATLMSRSGYSPKYENVLVPSISEAMSGSELNCGDECLAALIEFCIQYPLEAVVLLKAMKKVLGSKLFRYILAEQGFEQALAFVFPDQGSTAIETLSLLGDIIFQSHYPTVTLAWMRTLDGAENFEGKTYRKLKVACPVDVFVYSGNQLVAQIINDEPVLVDGSLIGSYVDGTGQKVFILPADAKYEVEVKATGDGNMSYTVEEYSLDAENAIKSVSYDNIQISNGDVLNGVVENLELISAAQYPLYVNHSDIPLTPGDQSNVTNIAALLPGALEGAANMLDTTFADVPHGAYYYNAVEWAYSKGIAGGVDAKHFAPSESCTRAQAVTMLYRAAGCPDIYGENPFVDVSADDYYYKAVLWAVANGITSGTDATHFSPDEPCTRGQIVTFLHRAANCLEAHENYGFADVKPGSYCEDAVNWAVETGITNGTGVDTFSPDAPCTRAQIVTFLYRNR